MPSKTIAAVVLAIFVGVVPNELSVSQPTMDLDQNWSASDRDSWYSATQGSRLIPRSWLEALTQPGSDARFLDDEYIASFRYLPRGSGALPVGFAIDESDDDALSYTKLRWKSGQSSREQWVGFNCAACHTAEITYKSQHLRIDGGPTLADFQSFIEALDRALTETKDQPGKFALFAKKVLGEDETSLNRESLKAALAQLVAWEAKVARMNQTDLRYGFGRLDAFGHIFNKVALVVDARNPTPNPADAPVSYPFLWNVPQEDWVQWNSIAPNHVLPSISISQPFDIGALGRNTGEVIGVFADVKPTSGAGFSGYSSSVNVGSLVSMEQLLGKLRPPVWPAAVFGALDPTLVAKGKTLYKSRCQSCHEILDRTDLSTQLKIKTALFADDSLNRTDPWMACNAYLDQSETGVLRGAKRDYVKGDPLGPTAPLADMLATTVEGVLVGSKGDVLESMAASFFGRQPPPVIAPRLPPVVIDRETIPTEALTKKEMRLQRCLTEKSLTLGYKSRPLNGIWAASPYLHNGSIPTLYDLLLPPDERPTVFWLGTREFDPKKVGFITSRSEENYWPFRSEDTSGRSIDGNSNDGHDYGSARLQVDERYAIIEYLKSL